MNLKKNHKIYVPYLLTCIFTVMLFYALGAIAKNNGLAQIRGGTALPVVMGWVTAVAGGFALIFLFYTNSFLIKQRKKELGLYQVLGMDKKNLSVMMLWETLITGAVSLGAGLLLGLALGKLMFLVLLKIIHFSVPLDFAIEPEALLQTVKLFLAVFALNLAYDLFQVMRGRLSEMVGASRAGEKEPKGKWLIALAGLVTLGSGYYIAQTADSPLTAVNVFFFAVILVVIGTYMLFISGSIVLLKLLKKNKRYYYRTKHFTAVSGMLYRMKQNAAGLANICIMSTAVIVVLSMCVCLYAGIEDSMDTQYPRDVTVHLPDGSEEGRVETEKLIAENSGEIGVTVENQVGYRMFLLPCMLREGEAVFGNAMTFQDEASFTEYYRSMILIPLEDYNRILGSEEVLAPGEALIYAPEDDYAYDSLLLGDEPYQVKKVLENVPLVSDGLMSNMVKAVYVILPDVGSVEGLAVKYGFSSEELNHVSYVSWFDMEGEAEACETMVRTLEEQITAVSPDAYVQYKEDSRDWTYAMNGGALFIGIFVGALFLLSTVLLIYYKQISEGYDDRENYQIMQKVGMDRREVRRVIRSQILAVFFLPLLGAFLHVAFAFRVMTMLLEVMFVANVPLFLLCTAGVTAVFTVFYVAVYMITSREYYRIVR
ncbi:MAG TPA: FtsX-like permease family protein [Candidatus Mediterraneibacter intestinipullorum]|nr:FtsX-like permease family protein [Candidatus Mediterraneibacter intestinipullorum]